MGMNINAQRTAPASKSEQRYAVPSIGADAPTRQFGKASFLRKLIVGASCVVAVPCAFADANDCVTTASNQFGSSLTNGCNQDLIVTYCFSDSYCDAPRGQGRAGHELRSGATVVISGTPRRFHYHACVYPEFPDGERGCTQR